AIGGDERHRLGTGTRNRPYRPRRGRHGCQSGFEVDRKPIVLSVRERVAPWTNGVTGDNLSEDVVDECQDLRSGAEADCDRTAWRTVRPQRFDELSGLVDD